MDDQWFTEHGGLLLWGAVLGVIGAALVGYFFYRLTIKPKKVDWLPLNATSILVLGNDQRAGLPDLHIVLDEKGRDRRDIENPNLILVRIANTGLWSVVQSDFDPRIEFDFGETVLLRAAVIKQAKKSATIKIEDQTEHRCALTLSSLDKGHWFDVQFITDAAKPEYPSIGGEIIGRRPNGQLRRLEPTSNLSARFTWAAVFAFFCSVILAVVGSASLDERGVSRFNTFFDGFVTYLFYIALLAAVVCALASVFVGLRESRVKKIRGQSKSSS